jgi:hypothetical protein
MYVVFILSFFQSYFLLIFGEEILISISYLGSYSITKIYRALRHRLNKLHFGGRKVLIFCIRKVPRLARYASLLPVLFFLSSYF